MFPTVDVQQKINDRMTKRGYLLIRESLLYLSVSVAIFSSLSSEISILGHIRDPILYRLHRSLPHEADLSHNGADASGYPQ